ncbi:hypothetical protein JXA88_06620, partial [Candidatus Fermentibacteria bacterium]|nr:hypothetical protein [Candidatus Fermentibacteria bacterium]
MLKNRWRVRRWSLVSKRRAWPAILLALLSCGGGRDLGVVSLMDGIPDDLPAGPWRVVYLHDRLHDGAVAAAD